MRFRWRRLRLAIALWIAAILLSCGAIVRSYRERPLSPLESRLVGQWISSDAASTRIFRRDRSFSTADGQYEGQWFFDGNRLTLEYWMPLGIRDTSGVDDFVFRLRRSGKTHIVAWEIEFDDDDRTHTLIFPEDHERSPGERWKWMRRPGKWRAGQASQEDDWR